MLKHLYIHNFILIDKLELDFDTGLTVLTGETGAGKSILLGALHLVLGDRADTDTIRQGTDFAEIVAEFDVSTHTSICSWLVTQELNAEDECILRRRITRDGRSRAYINGTPVNLQNIRELAEMLMDIHGQHEHQSMMKPAVQRQLLDDYAAHSELLKKVSNQFVELKLVEEQYQHLLQTTTQRNDRVDLLRFQTRELDELALEDNEYLQLNTQHQRLANAESLQNGVQQTLYSLSDDDNRNIQSGLAGLQQLLEKLADMDKSLLPAVEFIQNAQLQLDESISLLRGYQDTIELDNQRLAETESRIQTILDLARKHQVAPEFLHETHQNLLKELHDIDHADERLDELKLQYEQLEQKYLLSSKRLSESRHAAARKLNKNITRAMQTLGMSGGKFIIEINSTDTTQYSAHGLDKIEFTVTANSGQTCKPVARVASGGELARISLAIQMIIAKTSKIPTLIFDEVDSGIGGGIADIVGQHLASLGQTNQLICITHLAQVASQGQHHLLVEKHTRSHNVSSHVVSLTPAQRIEEIARMLSGVKITAQSRVHAEEMLTHAKTDNAH